MFATFLQNDVSVLFVCIAATVVVPAVTGIVARYLHRNRRTELEASLKMKMLEMGMSAADIERVIKAEGPSWKKDTAG